MRTMSADSECRRDELPPTTTGQSTSLALVAKLITALLRSIIIAVDVGFVVVIVTLARSYIHYHPFHLCHCRESMVNCKMAHSRAIFHTLCHSIALCRLLVLK